MAAKPIAPATTDSATTDAGDSKAERLVSTPVSVVVAIDVGTDRSGIAYAFVKRPDEIICDQVWSSAPGAEKDAPVATSSLHLKTRTALLLNADSSFVSFGDLATQRYLEMEVKEQQAYMYFDHFKMALYSVDEGHDVSKATVAARNGSTLPLVDVFTHTLRYLREHALTRLKHTSGNAIVDDDIRWIITVPAIWGEAAKQVMRSAATKAGFPTEPLSRAADPDSIKFMMALESEAAAICCRYHENKVSDVLRSNNARLMVLDAGGGTADITSHKVCEDQSVGEVHQADGGNWGSWYVDEAFVRFLQDALGFKQLNEYRAQNPGDFLELQGSFESLKHRASVTAPSDTYYRMPLPLSFIKAFLPSQSADSVTIWPPPSRAPPKPAATVATAAPPNDWVVVEGDVKDKKSAPAESNIIIVSDKSSGVDHQPLVDALMKRLVDTSAFGESKAVCQRGALRLSQGLVMGFFMPLLRQLIGKMDPMLRQVGASHLFVVGGFAESPVTWSLLHNLAKLSDIIPIRPPRASLAVLTGAVLFGLQPSQIKSRIVRKTYGMCVSCEWNSKKHSSRPKSWRVNNGVSRAFCDGIFSPFCLAGDTVRVDQAITQIYTPGEDRQDCMVLKVYQSTSRHPTYISEPDASLVAVLNIEMPEALDDLGRKVRVTMEFGNTEIRVSAVDLSSEKTCQVRLQFIQNTLDGKAHVVARDKTTSS